MWSQLSGLAKYADVGQLKATAERFKGHLSEFSKEVLDDLEESEQVAKDNIEQYREQRRLQEQEQAHQHQAPVDQQHALHHHANGDAPLSAMQPAGHFGESFSSFSQPLLDAPTSFPITDLSESEVTIAQAHELSPSHATAAVHSFEHQTNGFPSTHQPLQTPTHPDFSSPSAYAHSAYSVDTNGSSTSAENGLVDTPITHSHDHLTHTSEEDHGGLVLVNHVESSLALDESFDHGSMERMQSEMEFEDVPQQHEMLAEPASQPAAQDSFAQQYYQEPEQQQSTPFADVRHESELGVPQFLAPEQQQQQQQLQYASTHDEPAREIASYDHSTASFQSTPPIASASGASEESLDVQAVLGDFALRDDEKLDMLAAEIEMLHSRVAQWKTTAASATNAAAMPVVDSADSAVTSDARAEALQEQLDDLTSQLESAVDEKTMLSDILAELKQENEKVLQDALDLHAATEANLRSELQQAREEATTLHSQVAPLAQSDELAQLQAELNSALYQNQTLVAQQAADQHALTELQHQLEGARLELAHQMSASTPIAAASADIDPTDALTTLQAQFAELQKSHDKLALFRSQGVSWKQQAEKAMQGLKGRKEEVQASMKRKELRWAQERTELFDQIRRLQLDPSAPVTVAQPAPSWTDNSDLLRAEHAAALSLQQAQLDLARQQLSMQNEQISALQVELQSRVDASNDSQQRDAFNEERIRAEYLGITDAFSQKLQEAHHQLAHQTDQFNDQSVRMHQLQTELSEQRQMVATMQAAVAVASQHAQDALATQLRQCNESFDQRMSEAQHQSATAVQSLQQQLAQQNEAYEQQSANMQEQDATVQSLHSQIQHLQQQCESQLQHIQGQQQQHDSTVQTLQQQLQHASEQLRATQDQLAEVQAATTATAASPSTVPAGGSATNDAALVEELRAQIASLQSKLAHQSEAAGMMASQLNSRYEQLLSSFTALQARCRDGLDGEEGNLAQIAELRSTVASLQATAQQSQADLRKADQSKAELTTMTMRWREAMSEADGLRTIMKQQVEAMNDAREAASDDGAMPSDHAVELHALKQQVHNLQLDAASMESLQSDYARLQAAHDMGQTMLAESRSNLDDTRRAMADVQLRLQQAEQELADRRNRSDEVGGAVAAVASEASYKQVAELQAALQHKTQQLAELSNYSSSIEHDNSNLRKSFEQTLGKLKQFSSEKHLVDRRLVVKMLVTFFERADKDEVISLMSRVLQFSTDDLTRIQKGRQGVLGRLGSFLSAPAAAYELPPVADNLADSWIEFLMQESNKAEKEGEAHAPTAVAPPPTATTRARMEAAPSMYGESEFEARPNRAPRSTAAPAHLMPLQPFPTQVAPPSLPVPAPVPLPLLPVLAPPSSLGGSPQSAPWPQAPAPVFQMPPPFFPSAAPFGAPPAAATAALPPMPMPMPLPLSFAMPPPLSQ